MRAVASDCRLHRRCFWEGAVNASPSILRVNGAVVRRNLAADPAATRDALIPAGVGGFRQRWAGNGGSQIVSAITNASDGPTPSLRSYLRKTWTVVGAGVQDVAFSNSRDGILGIPVAPGLTYSVSSWLRTSWSENGDWTYYRHHAWDFADANGTLIASSVGADVPRSEAVAGQWNRLTATFTAPATAAYVALRQRIYCTHSGRNPTIPVGSTLDTTGLLIEQGTLRPYFDGNTPTGRELLDLWP